MKFASQIGLAVVAVIGLVAGVTFISHYTADAPTDIAPPIGAGSKAESGAPAEIRFLETVRAWDPTWLGEVEHHTGGQQDFLFQNPSNVDIELGLILKSCKCAEIYACVLTGDMPKRYVLSTAASASAEILAAARGFLPTLTQFVAETESTPKLRNCELNIQKLDVSETAGVTVPRQSAGFVRISWGTRKDKLGSELLKATMWWQPKEGGTRPRSYQELELPVNFISSMRVYPPTSEIPEMGYKEARTVNFVCYSSTRAYFPLEVYDRERHPCIKATVSPVNFERCEILSKVTNARVLSAYDVKVTLNERISDSVAMDLGPLHRRLIFKSSPDVDEYQIALSGMILGDLTVGLADAKGQVGLGTFQAKNGVSKVLPISTDRNDIDLDLAKIQVDPPELGFLKVRLEKASRNPGGPGKWNLHVKVEPGCPPGSLPDRAAIYLQITGVAPRLVRVPVTGLAYQR